MQNNLAALYSQNAAQRPAKKNFRNIPQAPERILDAPELLDDYYLNLLDWGPMNNVVCDVFAWHQVCKSNVLLLLSASILVKLYVDCRSQ